MPVVLPAAIREFRPLQLLFLNLGPLAALALIWLADLTPGNRLSTYTAALALWMAIWWMSECAPLAVTALLPLVFMPGLGVLDGNTVATQYFNSTVMLFLGGFIIALAMQRWGLHRRIALQILRRARGQPALLLAGFMGATAFLSMWLSNTATCMMMLPIALSVLARLEEQLGAELVRGYSAGLLLAIAYSASIGGITTPIGSPPNLILMRQYSLLFPDLPPVSFARWTLFFVPITLLLLLAAWGVLNVLYAKRFGGIVALEVIDAEAQNLGPLRFEERIVLGAFSTVALLWMTRTQLDFGDVSFPGWGLLFTNAAGTPLVDDGTVAIALALLLFLIPSRTSGAGGVLRWEDIRDLPWGIILLFGGGFALAEAFTVSGLSGWFGAQLAMFGALPLLLLLLLLYVTVTALSEFASNTASAQLVLPIVAALAVAIGAAPLLLMLPATIAASLDFILPAATPPNAMVMASGRVRVTQMARAGVFLELGGAVIVSLAAYYFAARWFGL